MKRNLLALFLTLLLTAAGAAETVGAALQQAIGDLQSVESVLQEPAESASSSDWAQSTLAADLDRLSTLAEALGIQLQTENDAAALQESISELKAAARRAQTSSVLLPPPAVEPFERAQGNLEAVIERLDELRSRFGGHATIVEAPLETVTLVRAHEDLASYPNPEALLIDVRELYRLASSLRVGGFPQQGVGFGQPNNLDGLQVRRFVLAANALERDLTGRPADITETLPNWERVQMEYLRLGYPGDDENVRQLVRVMDRLQPFFQAVGQPDS